MIREPRIQCPVCDQIIYSSHMHEIQHPYYAFYYGWTDMTQVSISSVHSNGIGVSFDVLIRLNGLHVLTTDRLDKLLLLK